MMSDAHTVFCCFTRQNTKLRAVGINLISMNGKNLPSRNHFAKARRYQVSSQQKGVLSNTDTDDVTLTNNQLDLGVSIEWRNLRLRDRDPFLKSDIETFVFLICPSQKIYH